MTDVDEFVPLRPYRPVIWDRPRRSIWGFALLAALAVVGLHLLFPFSALTPQLAYEAVIVEGLRAPGTLLPGLWRRLVSLTGTDVRTLTTLGAVASGLFVFLLTVSLRYLLAMLVRPFRPQARWTIVVAPLLSIGGALGAAAADPVWRAFALFSPAALDLLLALVGGCLFLRWICAPSVMTICVISFLYGVLLSESPIALFFLFGLLYAYFAAWRGLVDETFCPPHPLPSPLEAPFWRLFMTFVFGLSIGLALNVSWLESRAAYTALGWPEEQVLFRLAVAQLTSIWNAASWPGWTLLVGLALLPFVIVAKIFPRMTDEEQPFPIWLGVVALGSGVVLYFSQGPFATFRFWTWTDEAHSVRSLVLLSTVSATASLGCVLSLGVFCFDAFCRPHDEVPRILMRAYRLFLIVLTLGMIGAAIWSTRQTATRQMLDFVGDTVCEVVDECGEAEWIFTDGVLDNYLEREAHRRGKSLKAVSFVATSGFYEIYLRQRGLDSADDLEAAEAGGAVLFRTWAETGGAQIDRSALQMGFDYFSREAKPMPKAAAFVARTIWTDADVTNASAVARAFADRILALRDVACSPDVPDDLRKTQAGISWRLSQLARVRDEDELAERLDRANDVVSDLVDKRNYERMMSFMWFTPRERLQISLRQADFVSARRFALAVLRTDEDDLWANFAMGMSYIAKEDLVHAEPYLRKCLEINPDQPVVLNNLSILCRKTGRTKEALDLARQAAKALPNTPEVQRTLRDAQKAAAGPIK